MKIEGLISMTKLQDFYNYTSENPQVSIWNQLLLYSDYNVLKKTWLNHTEEEYIYVATSINQAHEYFKASNGCSIKTRPLLLYYCFLNLTKASLFLIEDKLPNSAHHGLGKPGINQDILKVTATSGGGLFKDLSTYFKFSYADKTKFSFEQLIKNIPELIYPIKAFFGLDSNLVYLDVKNYLSKGFEISLPEVLFNSSPSFKRFLEDFEKEISNGNVFLTYHSKNQLNETERVSEGREILKKYCQYSVLDYEYYFNVDENAIPIESSYYGAMFILSSIVRYYPTEISAFTIEKGESSAGWFISQFCDIAARVYPNLMMSAMANKQLKYLNH
ncbi:MAG: YaaC family protein [Bacteroidota bacterium]|nr:YaaC family protein [Bacteroidota bacterium]